MSIRLLNALSRRAHAEDGQSLAEYGMTMALVVLVCVALVAAIGAAIGANFVSITGSL
jgi:Flp pilus assembly pilin Flp